MLLITLFRQSILSFTGAYDVTSDIASSAWNWFSESSGMTEQCPFKDEMAKSVNETLYKNIRGQSEGINIISNAFSSWEFEKRMGYAGPLVLALTGPTGTLSSPLHTNLLFCFLNSTYYSKLSFLTY